MPPKLEPVFTEPKAPVFVFVPKALPVLLVEPKIPVEGVEPNPVLATDGAPNEEPGLLLLPKAFVVAGCCPNGVVLVLLDPKMFEPVPVVEPNALVLLEVLPNPPKLVDEPNAPACWFEFPNCLPCK